MPSSKIGKSAIIASAAGLLMAGGGAIAFAATGDSGTKTPAALSSSTSSGLPSITNGQGGSDAPGGTAPDGTGEQGSKGEGAPGGRMGGGHGMDGGMGGHSHTPVTGDELTKVKAAITAEDSAVTVTEVVKDEDGSYDAFGTKDGQPVRIEVSADLKTVEIGQGRMGRGGPGMGMPGQGAPGQGQQGSGSGQGTLPVPSPSTSNTATT